MHVHACAQTHTEWTTATTFKPYVKILFNYQLITIPGKSLYSDFVTDIKKNLNQQVVVNTRQNISSSLWNYLFLQNKTGGLLITKSCLFSELSATVKSLSGLQ